MDNKIGETFSCLGQQRKLWNVVKENYSSSENTSKLFETEAKLCDLRQGDLKVTQYFNTLSWYW